MFSLFVLSSGVGILSIPYALSSGGWLSLILLFGTAIATFYTSLLLKRCMDVDPNIKSYPDIGELAFGKTGRLVWSFSFCNHPWLDFVGCLYTSMSNKNEFSKVLLLCFIFSTIIYASMAIFGYLMFGSKVESQITLNLPTKKISSKVAIYTTLVNPIAKYALMVTPIVNVIENLFPYYNRRPTSLLIRIILVISTVIVALAIPFFGYLMSLVGAFLSVTASILLPCVCYLKVSGTYQRFGLEMAIIGGILLVGILIMIIGTYTSLTEIIGHL
ncbi:Amino acid transporter AVT1J [Camellia lanceoleosa]|uniref:Amino acid transporter AVT1J n=1 Tax=Camellia lanceoleosa TaxID=1840588 RepID=A0ACC0IZ69_9ERIC|nr:Amino acid transporter AVT1J [Camellia lanceoleosa]